MRVFVEEEQWGRGCITWQRRSIQPHLRQHTHTHTDTYYSPEGDRKRLLPLALRRGLEVFETRREWLTYIFERMHRKSKRLSMPPACTCSPAWRD
jgi:hypothetical protein